MTLLLEKAFSEAQKLPEHEQDVLASIIMEEMLAEKKWDQAFTASEDKLKLLADEAVSEFKHGRTKPLEFN